MKKINVLYLPADSFNPRLVTIDHNVESMQKLVGGCFDIVPAGAYIPDYLQESTPLGKYDIFVNDEGLLMELPPNICLCPHKLLEKDYDYAGILVGDIFLAGSNDEDDSVSILPEDVPDLITVLRWLLLDNSLRNKHIKWIVQ